MDNMNFINLMNTLNNMNNNMNMNIMNMNNNMNNNQNDMINFMNQMNNNMNINNINNMNYNDMINNINFNLNNINNNLNNIITSMNNINNILLNQNNNNYIPMNFIKEIINQNIQMANQISYNSNIINLTINNPLFFPNQNNINVLNNQIPNSGVLPRPENKKEFVDDFSGNNNRRINIIFKAQTGVVKSIAAPVNIKVKDLLLAYAKKMKINPNLLGRELRFLFDGQIINVNEEKDLFLFGFDKYYYNYNIIVVDSNNIIGGNSNFYFKLK